MPLALVLVLVSVLPADQRPPASIAFDLRGLSADEYHRIDGLALERKVALRLVQEGFAVVAPGAAADVEVRASMVAGGLALDAIGGGAALRATIATTPDAAAAWHLEVAHKISEMARALATASHRERGRPPPSAALAGVPLPPPPSSPAPSAVRAPATPTALAAPREAASDGDARPAPRWEVGLAAGAVWRAGGGDALGGVTATNVHARLRLHLEAFGARSTGPGIEVWEGQGSAGLGVALVEGHVDVDVGLAAGLVGQRFSLASQWATDSTGTHVVPAGWIPLYARWTSGHVVIGARAALGFARSLTHTAEGATLWSRGSVRLETMLVLAWAFR